MHPQVRLDRPGKCPICEMPLIPATAAETGSGGEPMLQLSDHALAMQRLREAGAGVVSTEMVVFEWLHSCRHPRFKEVLALLKTPAA